MIAPQRSSAGVEETRSRILAAAREVFERNGTRGTTTREVADRAGVNEATLFRHFGSKAALIAAMREDACGLQEIRTLLDDLKGEDIAADVRRVAHHSAQLMRKQRALMCIALAEDAISGSGTSLEAPEWRGPSRLLEMMADYFAARVAEGRLHGEPVRLARTFLGMLFQLVVARRLWGDSHLDPSTIDSIVDVFLNGVMR